VKGIRVRWTGGLEERQELIKAVSSASQLFQVDSLICETSRSYETGNVLALQDIGMEFQRYFGTENVAWGWQTC
jgi:hypothetical protein